MNRISNKYNNKSIFYNGQIELSKKIIKLCQENIQKCKKEIINYNKKTINGRKCSQAGKKYEQKVFNIVSNCCELNSIYKFNTQSINDLGGCKSKHDIICNWGNNKLNIPIEIKKHTTPDWMQLSLKYDSKNNKWIGSGRNKIPDDAKNIYQNLIDNLDKPIFNGKIPSFLDNNITHDEWVKIKKQTSDFNDQYYDCPNDTIKRLYGAKDCFYIQTSNKGLYHLGNDICNFNVPEFICDQQLRIRTKIHTRCNKKGYCNLSVMLSCMPKNINKLKQSSYSLDNINRLPVNLVYISD